MGNKIKAIETKYKGYCFRSRLEAGWAVFFENLGYKWEYEPEGFDLGDGVYYLPDFKITGVDTNGDKMLYWFEVKPHGVELSELDTKKIEMFANAVGDSLGYAGDFILLDGIPDENRCYKSIISGFVNVLWSERMRPWWDEKENTTYLMHADNYLDELAYYGHKYHYKRMPGNWVDDYRKAIKAARSARFEHGECG